MAKITTKAACDLARSLENVTEKDHFGSDAFYAKKRIFATVWHEGGSVNLRLTPEQQRQYLEIDGEAYVEINNHWGKQGWTKVQLEFADKAEFTEALKAAWANASAPPKRKPARAKK